MYASLRRHDKLSSATIGRVLAIALEHLPRQIRFESIAIDRSNRHNRIGWQLHGYRMWRGGGGAAVGATATVVGEISASCRESFCLRRDFVLALRFGLGRLPALARRGSGAGVAAQSSPPRRRSSDHHPDYPLSSVAYVSRQPRCVVRHVGQRPLRVC